MWYTPPETIGAVAQLWANGGESHEYDAWFNQLLSS